VDTLLDLQSEATPVIGWSATRLGWLEGRRSGIGGSDVAAALGMSRYTSPWELWADKTGRTELDAEESPSEAAELGNALEPWLLEQVARKVGEPAYRTPFKTYAHPEHPWRMCSPDGILADGRLVECKTAGLASGFGTPAGWGPDEIPLAYEFQARWAMHVMDAPAVEFIALVANLGVVHRTVERDLGVEFELVSQLSEWLDRHVVGDEEPAFTAGDAAILAELYPVAGTGEDGKPKEIKLDDTDAVIHWENYRAAAEREKAGKADKEAAGAELKLLLGDAAIGKVEGKTLVTWQNRKGNTNWKSLFADLAPQLETANIPVPDPEKYRGAPSRLLSVKEIKSDK
jgi:putative phage-type endonuclease